ncbi:hypothetical protein JHK85_048181 [Glycine max]|nr:hypothetical protein JHK85_048181 [Glycine max]
MSTTEQGYKGSVQIFYRQLGIRLDKDLVKVWNDDGAREIVKIAMDLIQKHVEVYIDHTSHMTEGVLLAIDEGGKPMVEGDSGNDVIDGKDSDREVDKFELDDRDKETDEDKGDDDNYEENDNYDGDDLDAEYDTDKLESDIASEEDYDCYALTMAAINGEDISIKPVSRRFQPHEMGRDFKFEVGMDFDSINQFKASIKEYANMHGFGLKFKKNDNVRCRVICQDSCEWMAYVSKVGGSTIYSMKTYNGKHTCAWSGGGNLATISESYCVKISSKKAYWARRIAKEKVQGNYVEQYNKLWDYANEVRRPIIGLDSCFLKTPFGGILLVAMGQDPNDQYYPLTVAIVESENKDSWKWFLQKLLSDIGHEHKWVFISNQQKELLPVFEHRVCVRHVYANMKKYFGGGVVLRDKMLAACKATYIGDWEQKMIMLKHVSKEVHDWLMQLDPRFWSKAHMSEYSRCDMIMNNISEAFNGRILEAREQPIVAMLEWIIVYMMTRFAKNRKLGEKQKAKGQKVCPRPMKRLNQEVLAYSKWSVVWGGGPKFEVQKYLFAFKVDLDEKTCSCRCWQLTGIPCRLLPSDFVHPYYHVDTYINCYASILEPINREDMWQQTGLPTVLPPQVRVSIGRPKKARRRENDEAPKPHKLKRTNTSLRSRVNTSNEGKASHHPATCCEECILEEN